MSIVNKILTEAATSHVVYYTSDTPINTLRTEPMWFEQYLEKAKCRHALNREMHTYEVSLNGNFLTREQYFAACEEFNINAEKLETDLVSDWRIAMHKEEIKLLSSVCDGFYHLDYDPCDYSKSIQTIFVFNPKKNARFNKEIFTKK